MIVINIANDFTPIPGPRFKKDGDFSGEEFREKILLPKFEEALQSKRKILVDFDGGYGYLISFLEEAFGGLSRIYDSQVVLSILEFKSDEEEALIEKVKKYIISAGKNNGKKK